MTYISMEVFFKGKLNSNIIFSPKQSSSTGYFYFHIAFDYGLPQY